MTHSVTVRHNFETAHRLPHLPGKCTSLHGHSWWTEVTVEAPKLAAGLVVEFGPFKRALRQWIDTHLDHGVMLGPNDPLLPVLRSFDCKAYEVTGWPTVENVAALLADMAAGVLRDLVRAPGARVTRVHLAETHVNAATWIAS
ncbi:MULTISPECIES: 6-pyruvoyl trahydropterin synthase family protein [Streptomycetaceae]|uniref:6-carboxy-5,6,7,8-tetrahydropterin synthase n=1 Tax=Streptantibioticus cattleyicolor (strain ATCC 35852 / DSM 46488 / JCM 4925 / NBRC 14057 / NRRL 8057) TaxID=1003195 RepID=F8JT14_STREN|nr:MULTISPECIES: 6-carboxytetrahydropterin synthase [Streptomycetaceae]AEW92949.1 6-pyruvoyl-tetrahydropterin synthase [Streptantibioticus cattleyicolor NRRL 8057 = DSM 46488]MYS57696.1 6-carboxytetrahydropterin synthase [Streptomyces sp. SID5468]CCB73310.1 6-pyruvoyl-tetrahydropterin synthase [Streptantibioticus cattleyicolor NRRL 8057 = DSM 46488]